MRSTSPEPEPPSEFWELMEPVQVEQDAAAAEHSIRQLTSEHPPPSDLSAVWFGLYEIGDHPNDVESVVELSGGPGFPDPDWLYRQTWHPRAVRHAGARPDGPPLRAPSATACFSLVTYSLTFAYSLALTCELINGRTGTLLLDDHDQLGSQSASTTVTSSESASSPLTASPLPQWAEVESAERHVGVRPTRGGASRIYVGPWLSVPDAQSGWSRGGRRPRLRARQRRFGGVAVASRSSRILL